MPRILLIEDDRHLRCALTSMLEQFGYEVEPATNAEAGLQLFRDRGARLVITDLLMNGSNGIDVVVAIAHGPQPVPVIVISGAELELLEHAKVLGATAVLQKPFTADELLGVLGAAFKHAPPALPSYPPDLP
jgi:DNA-binding response OmpR family regulator